MVYMFSLIAYNMINSLSVTLVLSVQLLSHVQLFATLWTVAPQSPLSMGFPRQEYWSGLPFPSPGNHPDPGIKLMSPESPALQADSLATEPTYCRIKANSNKQETVNSKLIQYGLTYSLTVKDMYVLAEEEFYMIENVILRKYRLTIASLFEIHITSNFCTHLRFQVIISTI